MKSTQERECDCMSFLCDKKLQENLDEFFLYSKPRSFCSLGDKELLKYGVLYIVGKCVFFLFPPPRLLVEKGSIVY